MFAAIVGGVRAPNQRAVASDPNPARMADHGAGDGMKTARRSAPEKPEESR
jgi:hypothetical protein